MPPPPLRISGFRMSRDPNYNRITFKPYIDMFGLSLSSDFVVPVICSAINKYDYFEGVSPSTALSPPNASSPAQSSSFSSLFLVFVAQPTCLAGAPPLPRPHPRRHPVLWPWHPRVAPVLRGHLRNRSASMAAAFLSSPALLPAMCNISDFSGILNRQ